MLRKLKTAKNALISRGPGEVFKLLRRNMETFSVRCARSAGSRMRRTFGPFIRTSGRDGRIRVLYVTERMEAETGQTVRYRIYHLREALKGIAHTRFEILENGVYRDPAGVAWADLLVLMRTQWSPETEMLVSLAGRLHVPVIFDIDDVVFLQDYVADFCGMLPKGLEQDEAFFRQRFYRYQQTFEHADFATASTPYIAEIMRRKGKNAYVIHNGLSRRQIEIAQSIETDEKKIRYIGYLSGTNTHNRDFLIALPALLRILEEYDDVRLRIVGYLYINRLPPDARAKTETLTFVKWNRLLKLSAGNYINIAPLDTSNPFCNAKSELKYFEAAIVGVPTVASLTDTFTRCIRHGVNGMLASCEQEWYDCIRALLDNRQLYESIQESAKSMAISSYAPQSIAAEATSAYKGILAAYQADKP